MVTEMHIRILAEIADGRLRVKELAQSDRPESWRVQLAVMLYGMGGVPRSKK